MWIFHWHRCRPRPCPPCRPHPSCPPSRTPTRSRATGRLRRPSAASPVSPPASPATSRPSATTRLTVSAQLQTPINSSYSPLTDVWLLFRKGATAANFRHDDEVPWPEARARPQDLQHHWQTQGEEAFAALLININFYQSKVQWSIFKLLAFLGLFGNLKSLCLFLFYVFVFE